MADENKVDLESAADAAKRRSTGYHMGSVDAVMSVDEVTKQAKAMAQEVPLEKIAAMAGGDPFVNMKNLRCGYGKMEIIHGMNLQVAKGQSLCLIGPNGAGKSTILHAIYGLNTIMSGQILVGEAGR